MQPNIDYDRLVDEMMENFWQIEHLKSFSAEDIARMKDAYELAREAHKPQVRKGGGPYITHPISVARILAEEFQLGANPIIAGFLHDVVEDTSYTIEDIEERYGKDVAFLVGTVTKRKGGEFEMSQQMDNYKQILSSIHYDIRALLVKLADRLHNMSTLSSMKPDKQMKIAGETDYFYAPLANRLGLYEAKTKLENLSLQFRCPNEYATIEKQMEAYKESKAQERKEWCEQIKTHLESYGISATVEIKYCSIYTIWRKMQQTGSDFEHISHKYVIQITFAKSNEKQEKESCLRIYSALTDICKELPGSIRNYVDSPKENGYQAFHFKVLSPYGSWQKIQIASERMAYNSKFGCTTERNDGVNDWVTKFREVLQDMAQQSATDGFMEGVEANFYNDDIFVYTPKGATVTLPKGATVIDFAYGIDPNIGNHAQFARINGVVASVKSELHRGDCVEIGTNQSINPKREWLAYATTYKAKSNIESYLRTQKQEAESLYKRCDCCDPLPGEEVMGFVSDDGTTTIHKRNCQTAIRLSSQRGDKIVGVEFNEGATLYPVSLSIVGIDRYHLLSDLVDVVTNELKLSIVNLTTTTIDEIVNCTINFAVHSAEELDRAINHLRSIENIEEVRRVKIKITQ
ncbi:MAG: HD domain-containing protein [Rikenellaceae bacterium]